MNCQQFDDELRDYLDGVLDAERCAALERHAAECPRCESLLDRATARAVAPLDTQPPPEVRSATLEAIRQVRRAGSRRRLGVVAAVAAVAVIAVSLQPSRKSASDVPGGASILLAAERAKPEFDALDEAARELEAALRQQPGDADLQSFLATVNERRAALSRLVRDAAS